MTSFAVYNPATEAVIAEVPNGNAADATAAVDAAAKAFPDWASTAPRVRAEVLRKAYEFIIADTDHLAGLITAENGKSEADARAEVAYSAEFFRWFSEEAVRTDGGYGSSPQAAPARS